MDAPPAMGLLDAQDSAEEPLEEPAADEAPETQGDSNLEPLAEEQETPEEEQRISNKDSIDTERRTELIQRRIQSFLHREAYYESVVKSQNTKLWHLLRTLKASVDAETLSKQQRRQTQSRLMIHPDSRENNAPGLQELTDEEREKTAETPVHLVPIRLDLESPEGLKLKDTFTWNMHEQILKPETFAEMLCEDLNLPHAYFVPAIATEIKEQIQDHFQHFPPILQDLEPPRGRSSPVAPSILEPPLSPNSIDASELRMLIKLDITINNYSLIDQFEWDLMCKRNDPEAFALKMTQELGLCQEFVSAIAHSIREQIHSFAKALLLLDYTFKGGPIEDEELSSLLMPPVSQDNVYRSIPEMELFGPRYIPMSQTEFERIDKESQRDARRKRRQTQRSRRAIAVVDKESFRTHRTPIGPVYQASLALTEGVLTVGSKSRPLDPLTEQRLREILTNEAKLQQKLVSSSYVSTDRSFPIWKCAGCQKTARDTPLIRQGLDSTSQLCDPCGLVYMRTGVEPPSLLAEDDLFQGDANSNLKRPSWFTTLEYITKQRIKRGQQSSSKESARSHSHKQQASISAVAQPPFSTDSSSAPEWLVKACAALAAKYPYDHFDVSSRPVRFGVEHKIQCFDCDGKLYQTGSGQTLSNFEIHLKNRSHRANVQRRLESTGGGYEQS